MYTFNSFVVNLLLKQQIMSLNNYITAYNTLILIPNVGTSLGVKSKSC